MKTLITLNVGLETNIGTRLDVHIVIYTLAACGLSITTSGIVAGEWEGKEEQTLVVQGLVSDPAAFETSLGFASILLGQDCIAFFCNGLGVLVGKNPQGYAFDTDLFHFHPRQ
jgi:hypothetical protein